MYPEKSSASGLETTKSAEKGIDKDRLYDELYRDIVGCMQGLEYDVSRRNSYQNARYRAVYQDGIYKDIDIPAGEWFAEYNLLARVIEIQVSQLFGRGFTVISDYSKEDLSAYQGNPTEQGAMQLKNKKLKADADLRQRIAASVIKDNGGMAIFEDGGEVASVMGEVAYKLYVDEKAKKVVISLLEKPQNLRFGWKADNFREWDYVAYVYQISVDSANRLYKRVLKDGETFHATKPNMPFQSLTGSELNTIYGTLQQGQTVPTDRAMVTVVDFTGNLPGWAADGGGVKKVKVGEETPFNLLCVGGKPAQFITDEAKLPKYYKIDNRWVPGQSHGNSDISDSLIDINKEIVRLMRDMGVWADKNLWKTILAKGFTPEAVSILKGKKRTPRVLTASPEQSLEEVGGTMQPLSEFSKLVDQKLDLFVRLAGIGRVLFDDPTVNANSNQALMTTLKGVVDIVERKQKQWTPQLQQMFRDALIMSTQLVPELKEAITDDPNWNVDIEWPSVLRREDATYQTMLLNMVNAKLLSVDTYLQKALGAPAAEELDRLRDNYSDPITAAILGGQTALLAQQVISPPSNTPPPPDVKYNVQIKADASLDPRANADLIRVVDPQLPDGVAAAEDGAMPTPDQANPQLTADQNTGQAATQAGSGAPAVSAEGAVAQAAQNRGV